MQRISKIDRVTRLGEFWPIWRLFTLGSFRKIAEGKNVDTFSTFMFVHTSYINFGKKG
jgi:hypothetical protein